MTTDVGPVDTGLSALSNLNVTNDDVVTYHSGSPEFAERISRLSFEDQCDVIDMIARPYWLSLFAQKAP